MKTRRLLVIATLALGVGINANAQFNIGNRIKNKITNKIDQKTNQVQNQIQNKIDNTVDNAVDKVTKPVTDAIDNTVDGAMNRVTKTFDLAVEMKTGLNAPQWSEKMDIDELYDALKYYVDLEEFCVQKKNQEWLCSEKGEQSNKIINVILNRNDKNVARWHNFDKEYDRYKAVAKMGHDFLYEGCPTTATLQGNAYLEAVLKWYVAKAKKGKKNAKHYYTGNGGATRNLAFGTDRYTDSPEIQKQSVELQKLWDKLDADYKAKWPKCNPYMTIDEIKAEREAERLEAERKAAEAKAKREAEIEASKKPLKAGALNKTYNAKVLKLVKASDPDVIKVVIESSSWNVKPLTRRTMVVWIVRKDKDGNLIANDRTFAEDYMGGGKWGNLHQYGIGLRSQYVK